MKKILTLLLILFCTTGCFNYREMNELGIVSAMGIEKMSNGNYKVTVQKVNLNSSSNSAPTNESANSLILSSEGKTFIDALKNLSTKTPRELYFAHNKVVVLDESVLKSDIDNIIDVIVRNTEMSLNYQIITTIKNTPEEILGALSPLANFTVNDITNTLETATKKSGLGYSMTLDIFLNNLLSYGIEPVYANFELPVIDEETYQTDILKDSDPASLLELKNLVFINDKKEIVELTNDEILAFNIIKNNLTLGNITSKCTSEDKYFSLEIAENNTETTFKKDTMSINSDLTLTFSDFNCDIDLEKEENIKKIEKSLNEKIASKIESVINTQKENNTDILGFGNYIYKNNPKYFNFKKDEWNKTGLNKIKTKVKVKTKIVQEGNLKEGVFNAKDE